MWRAFQKQEAEKAASICLAFFFLQYSSAPLPSAPTAPPFSPVCICFPRMRLVMPLFPHFPLWCDECFAYAYWVSGSNAKPSLAICFPFAFGTRTIVCWHRIGSRVGFCLRLWGCVSKPVHGCVGVLLHATPQLSSAGYFIWWCMQVLCSSATLEVTNTPSPILSMTTRVSTSQYCCSILPLPHSRCLYDWDVLSLCK